MQMRPEVNRALAAAQTIAFDELSRKVCISRLPAGMPDDLMKKLLSYCGVMRSWKRFLDANG